MTRIATIVVENRSGRRIEVQGAHIDDYRVPQMMAAEWTMAGTLFCYLGVANPFGPFDCHATIECRIVEIK